MDEKGKKNSKVEDHKFGLVDMKMPLGVCARIHKIVLTVSLVSVALAKFT